MQLIDKLNARIRTKVTPEVIARAERAATSMSDAKNTQPFNRRAEVEPETPGMRM